MVNSKTRKDRIGSSKYLKKCIYLYKFALTVAKTSVNIVIVLDTTCTTTSINSLTCILRKGYACQVNSQYRTCEESQKQALFCNDQSIVKLISVIGSQVN